jgi:DNA modification methylase
VAEHAAEVRAVTPFVQDADFTLYCGDALEVLRGLPDESVHCALTSPPFYALRDYGVEGQIGLEATPEVWCARLVSVFREVRRVLRSDGTLWVECGDSYNAYNGGRGASASISAKADPGRNEPERGLTSPLLKPKDLLLQPFLLAMALRADGWWLRQTIIWAKPNAMPESATDRCTTAHSYVFLLSKSARYHFDSEAIAEPAEWARWGDQTVPKYQGTATATGWMQPKTKAELQARGNRNGFRGEDDGPSAYVGQQGPQPNSLVNHGNRQTNGQKPRTGERRGFDNRLDREDGKKNPRSVWTIPTQGYPDAHFATWPEALVDRIIRAGCPEAGTVLDPFMGSGTTALVARKLGRKSVGIELNPAYAELAARRLSQLSLLAEATG